MPTFTAQELLRRHGIEYAATRTGKFTTSCPNCNGGYCNVKVEKDRVAWFCHGCEEGGSEKYEQRDSKSDLGEPKAVYDYTDERGERLFQALRFEPVNGPKQFRQRTGPDQEKWSVKGVRIVPFKLPDLIEDLAAERVVFVVEGEKDVLTLRQRGVPATCNPMGAGKWWLEFNEIFRGADVVICGDNDQPGRDHVALVAKNLHGNAVRIRVLDLKQFWPQIQESDDITDWFDAGGTVEQLWFMVEQLPDWTPGNGQDESPPWEHTPDESAAKGKEAPRVLSKAEFIGGFVPPDYLIEGVLQRRFIYSLTGQTGHAKTAVALLIARLVSCSSNALFGARGVKRGRVIYFAGENADDVRMRVIGMDSKRDDDPKRDNISFLPGQVNVAQFYPTLEADIVANGNATLIIIDTSAAYFLGNDEMSNTQMGAHARMLRRLTTLPGGPCVLVLCHPIKHVQEPSQLLPRGGSAFLAEVDGNLTLWRTANNLVELHWQGKFRGPDFAPMSFRLEPIGKAIHDADGRPIATIQAVAITQAEQEVQERRDDTDSDAVLRQMLVARDQSLADIARGLGWEQENGDPAKMKVQRILADITKTAQKKLVMQVRRKWNLTEAGKKHARDLALHAVGATDGQSAMGF